MKKLQALLLVALTLTACNTNPASESVPANPVSSTSQSQVAPQPEENEPTYPREVTLSDGTIFSLEEKPEKVVSLVFGTDEMMLDLIDTEYIVGVSGKDAGTPYMAADPEDYSDIAKVNDNPEVLLSLEPDFVIGSSWVSSDLKAILSDSDIPFYGYTTPKTMEQQVQVIKDLGYLLGDDEKTDALVRDLEARIDAVKTIGESIADEDKVKVMAYNMHGSSNSGNTIFDDMVTLAGAVNLTAEAGLTGNADISKEQIVDMNPEVIILLAWASDTDDDFEAFAQQLLADESLQTVDAIANNRVYVSMDNSITNVSQFAVDGLEFVAKSCYPELY